MAPFTIDTMGSAIRGDPSDHRARFTETPALLFGDVFAPALLERLMARAAAARFVDDDVTRIGIREVESSPQVVGGSLGILLGRPALYSWLEAATGVGPIRGIAGRLVQTRANGRDGLDWHDDGDGANRKLAVVVDLSDAPYEGGLFEMRRTGEAAPFLSHRHDRPGSMMVFAVRSELQHRVTELTSGGPRRVWAGWFLAEPEARGLPGS